MTSSNETPLTLSPPRVHSGILFVVGTLFLLLLNGQHFTNRVIFLAFVAASGFLWLRFRSSKRPDHPDAGRFALLIHFVVFFGVAATLPVACERQQTFNNAVNRVKTLSQTPRHEASDKMVPPE